MELSALSKIEKLGKAVAGMTQADLARAVGVSRERIRQLVPRMRIKPGKRVRAWHRSISRRECEAMAKLHDNGASLSEIGKRHGVSDYHVREAIRQVRPNLEPAGRIQRKGEITMPGVIEDGRKRKLRVVRQATGDGGVGRTSWR